MDTRTDRKMVLGFCPRVRVESRAHPRTGAAEYRVTYTPVPGRRDARLAWTTSEARAWQAACVRLDLRVRSGSELRQGAT